MDNYKLIKLIAENPQLWDHNNEQFRNQHLKATTWEVIAHTMGTTVVAVKETFKGLREKYIRERTKQMQSNVQHKKWELLDELKFLEPHIIPRRTSGSDHKTEPAEVKSPVQDCKDMNSYSFPNCDKLKYTDSISQDFTSSSYNFTRDLITLVYNCQPLWDRENNPGYDKQARLLLWDTIAKNLNVDSNTCILKWKGLREKYIRQKGKYTEGKGKWIFLDSLSFLDSVIHYRRKWQPEDSHSVTDSQTDQFSSDCDLVESEQNSHSPRHSISVKPENPSPVQQNFYKSCAPDSTLDLFIREEALRKRTLSVDSEGVQQFKKHKPAEEIFGELVTAILSKKSEEAKNSAMMEIMQVLTKNS